MKWSCCKVQALSPSRIALLRATLGGMFGEVWATKNAVRVSRVPLMKAFMPIPNFTLNDCDKIDRGFTANDGSCMWAKYSCLGNPLEYCGTDLTLVLYELLV